MDGEERVVGKREWEELSERAHELVWVMEQRKRSREWQDRNMRSGLEWMENGKEDEEEKENSSMKKDSVELERENYRIKEESRRMKEEMHRGHDDHHPLPHL